MQKLSTFANAIFTATMKLFNLDIDINKDAPGRGLLDFERVRHSEADTEYFGLGFHVIVSRFPYPVPTGGK